MRLTVSFIFALVLLQLGCSSSERTSGGTLAPEWRCYGVFNGGAPFTQQAKLDREKGLGTAPCVVMIYWDWDVPYNAAELLNIWNNGAIPMVTLEPWLAEGKQGIPLSEIASGHQDGRLYELARVIREYGHPIFLRFAHEMNGNWYPWSGDKNGRSGKAYIDAYRHVHNILTTATKPDRLIMWVWSVNANDVPDKDWNSAMSYFPGNNYADAVGIDGYNMSTIPRKTGFKWLNNIIAWGGNKIWGRFFTFKHIFGERIDDMQKAQPELPIFITEVATSLHGTQKIKWIGDLFATLKNDYPQIPLVVWFDTTKEADWRIGNDAADLDTFRDGLSKWKVSNRNALLIQLGMVERPND